MQLTQEHKAAVLEAHWRLLWPLPAAERVRVIREIELDMTYQAQLEEVDTEMSKPDPVEIVAVAIPVLAEAVAVVFAICVAFVWVVIFRTGGIG